MALKTIALPAPPVFAAPESAQIGQANVAARQRMSCYSDCYTSDPLRERNDCVVRALAIAADLPYMTAHAFCSAQGRKPGGGMYDAPAIAALEAAGLRQEPSPGSITLARFRDQHPRGRYVIFVRGHTLAVVDGHFHDWPSLQGKTRRRVRFAFRLND